MHPQAGMGVPSRCEVTLGQECVYPSQDQTPHNRLNQGSGALLLIKGIPKNRQSPQKLNQGHLA